MFSTSSTIYVNMVSHITTGKRTYANIQKKGGSVEIYVALQNMTEEITGNSEKKKAWCLPVWLI